VKTVAPHIIQRAEYLNAQLAQVTSEERRLLLVELLNKTIPTGECLEYPGPTDPTKYPQINLGKILAKVIPHLSWGDNKMQSPVSRVVWFCLHGKFPPLYICHKCDNPRCINPKHLFVGSAADNVHDSMEKGRFRPGERQFPPEPKDRLIHNAPADDELIKIKEAGRRIGGLKDRRSIQAALAPGSCVKRRNRWYVWGQQLEDHLQALKKLGQPETAAEICQRIANEV